jgi:type I restriction enzyme M protein
MPRPAKKSETAAPAARSLETQLWDAANKMRGAVPPTDYMHVCLGLVFLRYLSSAFETKQAALQAESCDTEDRDEYAAANIYWVPAEARWAQLAAQARASDIGKRIDDAMRALERDNEALKGVLPKIYGKPDFSSQMLGQLVDLFTNLNLAGTAGFDLLGRVYEFFLGEFSTLQGKTGGEFYTPRSIVDTLVRMIEPVKGRVYDPCCGTGGFFVQSERFIEAHRGRLGDIAIYGQERNPETWRLARMNLAIRAISADIRWNNEGTFLKDAHPDLRFDYILANPPFNIKDWSGELLREDKRWTFGVPPAGNANFAWLQHIHHHLGPQGFGGIVLANGSMSSDSGGEGDIRRAMVEAGAIDCMVALPGQLFFGVQIPACLWILAKNKAAATVHGSKLRDRRNEVLFIDARKVGTMISRTQKNFSEADIAKIATTYHAWRSHTSHSSGSSYSDIPGYCKSATLEDIRAHNHVLTPGRYVGAEDIVDDGDPFDEKMPRLIAELEAQFAESAKLEVQIRANLKGIFSKSESEIGE